MTEFDTNKQPGFHILICLIEIWKPKDKKKPYGEIEGNVMRICEVEEVEIEESYKKLIGTAAVRFPRGTIIRKTVTPETAEKDEDFDKVKVSLTNSGVIEENRSDRTMLATPNTFSIGQRIKIYLGYTTKPEIAELAKTGNTGLSIYNDDKVLEAYRANFQYTGADAKKHMSLMFDGYITKISVDSPVELECENLASFLKTITCPPVDLKKCEVKDFIGENSGYKLLEGTGLKLHSETAAMDFDLGGVTLSPDLSVADVLTEWAKFGLFCYVCDDNGQPAIKIARAYFSNPGKDSLLNASDVKVAVPVHFDYNVASNGLSVTSADKDFLAVQANGVDADDKMIHITVLLNGQFDPSKPESDSNPRFRYVNETKLKKKALKAGKRYLTSAPNDKVDMKLYSKISFVSKTIPVTMEALAQEAAEYLDGYNTTGIEGTLTLFGDLHLRTAQQVELIDNRYPNKNGIYLVEEVNTTFGKDGYRQKITLPYCISRAGNKK